MFWLSRISFDKGLPWFAFGCAAVFFVAPFTWPEGIPFPFQLGIWTLGLLSIAFGLWKSGRFTVSQHELIDTDETISDWPIHELFYYLCPDLVDRPSELLWEKVGTNVREKFWMDDNNALRVSGIPIEKDQMENWFSSNTRVPIPHTYWQHADFSYRFLEGEDGRNEPHTYDHKGMLGTNYSDIKINRPRALQVWPKPLNLKREATRPDYDLWDKEDLLCLSEAASLWIEEEPTSRTGEMSPEAKAMYRQLANAVRNRELSALATLDEAIGMAFESQGMATRDGDNAISVNLVVKRDALREYAHRIRQKPKFLFPGQRP